MDPITAAIITSVILQVGTLALMVSRRIQKSKCKSGCCEAESDYGEIRKE